MLKFSSENDWNMELAELYKAIENIHIKYILHVMHCSNHLMKRRTIWAYIPV